jgi:hypothetical protein
MKRFFLHATIFGSLILLTLFSVIYLLPVDQDKYLLAIVDKHRLLETVPQPRIIFAGDSNLAFGLDSGMVERATGYHIVNMGLHGGLGLLYAMDELKPDLKRNDIVILIPDYTHYAGNGVGDNTLVEVTIVLPKIICTYSYHNIVPFITSIPLTFQRRLRGLLFPTKEDAAHRRSNFNKYGDAVGHLSLPQPKFKDVESVARFIPGLADREDVTRILPSRVNDELVERMNEFAAFCADRGVRLYLSFSPIMEWKHGRKKEVDALLGIEKDLKRRVHMKVFGDPLAYLYPRDYFFDNEFHLNKKGREIRTRTLIESMRHEPLLVHAPRHESFSAER